jgi:phosphate transport system protein
MAEAAQVGMCRATAALLAADQTLAGEVVHADIEIDMLHEQVTEHVYRLLAIQAPVASDLRMVVTALNISADLARMGDLAVHVAKTALLNSAGPAVPQELVPLITDMAWVADRLTGGLVRVLNTRDAQRARQMERDDDAMDHLHRRLLAAMVDGAWSHGVHQAVDCALLGRWYERFADHAVNAARQMTYLVTGQARVAA